MRVGNGYDVHPLVDGRKLIIGGVDIPYPKGLDGHSDADVLVHAIIDALLGASGLGDIGALFPDHQSQWKDISSIALLVDVGERISQEGWRIENIDSIVVAQFPKIFPFIDEMKSQISQALKISCMQVSIKATTTEGLGFLGRSEGIAAYAVVCIFHEKLTKLRY